MDVIIKVFSYDFTKQFLSQSYFYNGRAIPVFFHNKCEFYVVKTRPITTVSEH